MEIFDNNFQINGKDEVVFAMVQTLNKEKNLNIFPTNRAYSNEFSCEKVD